MFAAILDAARAHRLFTTLPVHGGPVDGGRLPVTDQQRAYGTILTIAGYLYAVVQYRGKAPFLVFLG